MNRRAWPFLAVPALLGLPAAILAHTAIFGSAHVMGGVSHALLWALCAAFGAAIVTAAIASRRIRTYLPTATQLLVSTAAWFAAIELREQSHAIPVLQAVALLCAAALAVNVMWRGFTRAAHIVASELSHKLRITLRDAGSRLGAFVRPIAAAHAPSYKLFSRPPPV